MTENNQFTCRYNDENGKVEIIDLIKDEHYPMTETVVKGLVDCLNELYDENEQLKKQIKDMQIRFKRKYDCEFDDIVDELD